jgi:hypothetical protein
VVSRVTSRRHTARELPDISTTRSDEVRSRNHVPTGGFIAEISGNLAINLQNGHPKALGVRNASVPVAEVVPGDAAPRLMGQGPDEERRVKNGGLESVETTEKDARR